MIPSPEALMSAINVELGKVRSSKQKVPVDAESTDINSSFEDFMATSHPMISWSGMAKFHGFGCR